MRRRTLLMLGCTCALGGSVLAQPAPAPRGRARPDRRANKAQELDRQARQVTDKIKQLGAWEMQFQEFERSVDKVWQDNRMTSDSELFIKRVLVEQHRHPPSAVGERLQTIVDVIGERYGLSDELKSKLKRLLVGQGIKFGLKHGMKLAPIVQEMLDTRLAKKPFTSEQIARWAKIARPLAEEMYMDTGRQLQPLIKSATPEQQAMIRKDISALDKRMMQFRDTLTKRWEKGEWTAKEVGLDSDPIQQGLYAAAVVENPQPAAPSSPPPGAGGPMRLGENRPKAPVAQAAADAPLPDEDLWAAYVRQFCARYDLDDAQQAAANAVLRDLQEQAQAYRSSRSGQIEQLRAELRDADSSELRNEIQAELGELLGGIDALFEDLKGRLQGIPTSEQINRAG